MRHWPQAGLGASSRIEYLRSSMRLCGPETGIPRFGSFARKDPPPQSREKLKVVYGRCLWAL
jgi:hypothetical protein